MAITWLCNPIQQIMVQLGCILWSFHCWWEEWMSPEIPSQPGQALEESVAYYRGSVCLSLLSECEWEKVFRFDSVFICWVFLWRILITLLWFCTCFSCRSNMWNISPEKHVRETPNMAAPTEPQLGGETPAVYPTIPVLAPWESWSRWAGTVQLFGLFSPPHPQ